MKLFWKWLDDNWPGIVILAIVVVIVSLVAWALIASTRADNQRRNTCFQAGYDAKEYLDALSRWGCLDIREGGVYVVVPIETVRKELEATR
jgi:hypothetical protein